MISVALFGSRKYPGKVRSDLDLLIVGPSNVDLLVGLRSSVPHYKPLDLWLVAGENAYSTVNGSLVSVGNLRTYELFPESTALPQELRRQRFRADIDYRMTVIPPGATLRSGAITLVYALACRRYWILSLFKHQGQSFRLSRMPWKQSEGCAEMGMPAEVKVPS